LIPNYGIPFAPYTMQAYIIADTELKKLIVTTLFIVLILLSSGVFVHISTDLMISEKAHKDGVSLCAEAKGGL
jgi:hypothetical protein